MEKKPDLILINDQIQQIKLLLKGLHQKTDHFPAISKNSKRALASLKMMELSISDLVEFNLHE